MKISKKLLSFILCICIVIIPLTLVSSAGNNKAVLSAVNNNDGTVTVTVGVKDVTDMETCELAIAYNADIFDFVSSKNGSGDGLSIAQGKATNEALLTCSSCAMEAFTGTTTLAFYTLEIKDNVTAKTATLTFSGDSNIDDESVTGSVTVDLGHTHNYVNTVVKPTCSTDGYTLHKCSICGDEYKSDTVKASHTVTVVNKTDATRTKDGYTGDKVCSVCNETIEKGKVIPATGIYGDMDFDNIVTAKDAFSILKAVAKLEKLTDEQRILADVNKDGKLTAKDARKALRISAKLET